MSIECPTGGVKLNASSNKQCVVQVAERREATTGAMNGLMTMHGEDELTLRSLQKTLTVKQLLPVSLHRHSLFCEHICVRCKVQLMMTQDFTPCMDNSTTWMCNLSGMVVCRVHRNMTLKHSNHVTCGQLIEGFSFGEHHMSRQASCVLCSWLSPHLGTL